MGVYIKKVFSNTPSVCSVYASLLVGLCIATLMPEQHLHHKGLQGYLRPSAPFMALHWIINGFKNLKMVFWPPRVWYICISTFVRFESAKSFLKSFKPFFKLFQNFNCYWSHPFSAWSHVLKLLTQSALCPYFPLSPLSSKAHPLASGACFFISQQKLWKNISHTYT